MIMNIANKKILILVFCCLTIVFVVSVFLYIHYYSLNNKTVQETSNKHYIKERPFHLEDSQVTIIKPLSELANECDHQNVNDTNKCNQYIVDVASLNNNILKCAEIEDIGLRDKCVFRVINNNHNKRTNAVRDCERIANKKTRERCLTSLAINLNKREICSNFADEPFEERECLDRTLALNMEVTIKNKKDNKNKIEEIINACTNNLTLEYYNLCLQYSFNSINYKCDELPDGEVKDYCETFKINRHPLITKHDCQKIPLPNYRYVCLQEIKLQKDRYNFDTDNDGVSDGKELFFNLNIFSPDTDGDGLSDGEELDKYHSNPKDKDTDGDGLSDKEELEKNTDIQNPDSDGDGILDSKDDNPLDILNDSDDDGLTDEEEYKWGTDPNNKDTDGDGISDYEEIENGTNPTGEGWRHDADNDGLIDADERFFGTDPLNPDTDGDGYKDGDEVINGYNPNGEGKLTI